jgi:hypothetical protein
VREDKSIVVPEAGQGEEEGHQRHRNRDLKPHQDRASRRSGHRYAGEERAQDVVQAERLGDRRRAQRRRAGGRESEAARARLFRAARCQSGERRADQTEHE